MATLKTKFKTKVGDLMWVQIQPGGVDQSLAKDGSKMQKVASVQFADNSQELALMKAELAEIWENFRKEKNLKQKEPKSNGIKVNKDKETKEPNGTSSLIFKTNAQIDGKEVNVPVYNAKGDLVDSTNLRIGNGSKGIIHGEAALYEFAGTYGITLYLKAVQVAKLEDVPNAVETDDLTSMYPDSFGETFTGETTQVAPITADSTPNL